MVRRPPLTTRLPIVARRPDTADANRQPGCARRALMQGPGAGEQAFERAVEQGIADDGQRPAQGEQTPAAPQQQQGHAHAEDGNRQRVAQVREPAKHAHGRCGQVLADGV